MTPRVVIADATPFVRLAARVALLHDGLSIEAEVATAADADEAARRLGVDALLLDADLDPDMAVVNALHAARPRLAIIVLAPSTANDIALAAVRAGACGFIPKETGPERLPAIVRGAVEGEAAIPRRLVRRLLEELTHEARRSSLSSDFAAGTGLTTREQQVLSLLGDGVPDALVAETLGVSQVTVRRHIGAAMQKIGVTRRGDAIDRR